MIEILDQILKIFFLLQDFFEVCDTGISDFLIVCRMSNFVNDSD
jgi:hypothetical protein